MARRIEDSPKRRISIDPLWKRFIHQNDGHFEALVALENGYTPDYMKILGAFAPGILKVSIPPSALPRLEQDSHVLSAELREYIVC